MDEETTRKSPESPKTPLSPFSPQNGKTPSSSAIKEVKRGLLDRLKKRILISEGSSPDNSPDKTTAKRHPKHQRLDEALFSLSSESREDMPSPGPRKKLLLSKAPEPQVKLSTTLKTLSTIKEISQNLKESLSINDPNTLAPELSPLNYKDALLRNLIFLKEALDKINSQDPRNLKLSSKIARLICSFNDITDELVLRQKANIQYLLLHHPLSAELINLKSIYDDYAIDAPHETLDNLFLYELPEELRSITTAEKGNLLEYLLGMEQLHETVQQAKRYSNNSINTRASKLKLNLPLFDPSRQTYTDYHTTLTAVISDYRQALEKELKILQNNTKIRKLREHKQHIDEEMSEIDQKIKEINKKLADDEDYDVLAKKLGKKFSNSLRNMGLVFSEIKRLENNSAFTSERGLIVRMQALLEEFSSHLEPATSTAAELRESFELLTIPEEESCESLEHKRSELNTELDQLNQIYGNLQTDLEPFEKQISELDDKIKALDNLIQESKSILEQHELIPEMEKTISAKIARNFQQAHAENSAHFYQTIDRLIKNPPKNPEVDEFKIRSSLRRSQQKTTSSKKRSREEEKKQNYKIKQVLGDGDCGYTAVGITRDDAHELLYVNRDNNTVLDLLQPAIDESLHEMVDDNNFQNYLTDQEINLDDRSAVAEAYLLYDIHHTNNYVHPGMLQAIAHIQNFGLRIWQFVPQADGTKRLLPYANSVHNFAAYIPVNATHIVDIIFVNGNHYNLLEISPEYLEEFYPAGEQDQLKKQRTSAQLDEADVDVDVDEKSSEAAPTQIVGSAQPMGRSPQILFAPKTIAERFDEIFAQANSRISEALRQFTNRESVDTQALKEFVKKQVQALKQLLQEPEFTLEKYKEFKEKIEVHIITLENAICQKEKITLEMLLKLMTDIGNQSNVRALAGRP